MQLPAGVMQVVRSCGEPKELQEKVFGLRSTQYEAVQRARFWYEQIHGYGATIEIMWLFLFVR